MRVPVTGTKTVVCSTSAQQCQHPQQRPTFGTQYKLTFNQAFSIPQQKTQSSQQKFIEPSHILAFDERLNNIKQTVTMKLDHSGSQQKNVKAKSDSAAPLALNILVTDDDELVEKYVQNYGSKKLKDLMGNLSVKSKELNNVQNDSEEGIKVHKKENDCSKKIESLTDSFQMLTISAVTNKKTAQRGEKKNEEGELIERGPVAPSKKLPQPNTHPYKEQQNSARYSLQSGRVVAEQPYINSYKSRLSAIPQIVEEVSDSPTINVTKETEEIITSEILNENFKSFVKDWVSKQIEQDDGNIRGTSISGLQPPVFSEPTFGSISPCCSGDSAYSTLSPDINAVSPMSYLSPTSSPVYGRNGFKQQSQSNEIVTSNVSCSALNYLPNKPTESLDLIDLIDDYLNITKKANELLADNSCKDFVIPDKHNIAGDETCQNLPFYAAPSEINSVTPQILQGTSDEGTQELSHNNSATLHIEQAVSHNLSPEMLCLNPVAPHVLQVESNKLPSEVGYTSTSMPHLSPMSPDDEPLTFAHNVSGNRFHFTIPNAAPTTTPPKYILADMTPTNHVQPNVMGYPTTYIPANTNNQTPLNIPVANTASQFTYRHNMHPVIERNKYARKPDDSVISFIYGNSDNSKSVQLNATTKFSVSASSMWPVERQILPAGSEVYETEMSVPAAVRLKNLMKNMEFTVQYVKVCHDLANRPDLLKECLFQLLNDTSRMQNWLMCICAHIALAVSNQANATVLTARNYKGHSLLYLACVNHPDQSVVARYIADSLLEFKISPDEVCDGQGNSLVHLLASLGDSHVFVLAELLNVRHPLSGQPAFNVNRPNESKMETPLHIAVFKHSLPFVNCLSTVKILITHGANVTAQDKNAMTPLHYAVQGNCENKILTLLLQSPTSHAALDLTDFEHNSALHLAAANNTISLSKQRSIMSTLIGHGADYRLQNMEGKIAFMLVSTERHQEIKKLFAK